MANIIDDETIEYVGILAKLALSEEEKELKKYEFFPLCYLFSEKDVVFPSAKEKEVKEENTPDKEKGIPAEIDNELINTL